MRNKGSACARCARPVAAPALAAWNAAATIAVVTIAVATIAVVMGLLLPAQAAEQALSVGTHRPLVFGHRGGRKWAPENTLASFRRALAAHADGIELDIHRCATGELIVIHDETLERTTNGAGYVKDKTLAQLKALDAGSWYAPEFKGERLPLLSEVLDAVDGKAIVNVEIKNNPIAYPGIDDELIKLLAKYKYPDKIVVSSFDHGILEQFHRKAPQYKLGMLDDAIPAEIGKYAQMVGAQGWNPEYIAVRPDTIATAHSAGLQVSVWTPNKPDEWRAMTNMGVDVIITDDPAGLLEFQKKNQGQ